jgi:hypothetical protein
VKWGYRCERIDLIPSSDTVAGGIAHRKAFFVIEAFLRPLRRLAHRGNRI